MKKLLLLIFLLSVWLLAESSSVSKQVFVSREPGIFNVGPVMALNTKTKRTLVVWEKHPGNHPAHSTWSRLIGPSGKPAGKAFQIVSGPNTYGPAVTYNPDKNEFALVYGNEFTIGFQIFVQRLNRKGRPVGDAVLISQNSPADVGDASPRVIYNPDNRTYIVLFILLGDAVRTDGLYGAVLDENLSVLVNPVLIRPAIPDANSTRLPLIADLELDPTTGNLAIGFYQYRAGFGTTSAVNADYFLGMLDPMLNGTDFSFSRANKKAAKGFGFDMDIMFLENGNGFIVYTGTKNILRRAFTANGKFSGRAKPAFAAPLKKTKMMFPVLAFQSTSNDTSRLLLGVQDYDNSHTSGTIWAQQLNEQGKPAGVPIQVDADFESASEPALVALSENTGPGKFVVVYVEGLQTVIPPGNESSGLNLLQLELEDP